MLLSPFVIHIHGVALLYNSPDSAARQMNFQRGRFEERAWFR
jgi:hypothetical protein